MSYLLDKKIKRNKLIKIGIFAVFFVLFFYFRVSIFRVASLSFGVVFRPVLVLANKIDDKFSDIGSFFMFKNSLLKENEDLKRQIEEKKASVANYNSILDENTKMKEILNRKNEKTSMILGAILSKPDQSPYDTFVLDIGSKNGVKVGKIVFALGNIPIGRIGFVYPSSSKVVLFSSPGENTEIVVSSSSADQAGKDIFMKIVGRGGGNFEMILPRDFTLEKGTEVSLPGIIPYVLGKVETVISDPRDAFQKALLTSPINIFELKFVQVEI